MRDRIVRHQMWRINGLILQHRQRSEHLSWSCHLLLKLVIDGVVWTKLCPRATWFRSWLCLGHRVKKLLVDSLHLAWIVAMVLTLLLLILLLPKLLLQQWVHWHVTMLGFRSFAGLAVWSCASWKHLCGRSGALIIIHADILSGVVLMMMQHLRSAHCLLLLSQVTHWTDNA